MSWSSVLEFHEGRLTILKPFLFFKVIKLFFFFIKSIHSFKKPLIEIDSKNICQPNPDLNFSGISFCKPNSLNQNHYYIDNHLICLLGNFIVILQLRTMITFVQYPVNIFEYFELKHRYE